MIVAAHQPSYLPWLGYLDKMARADVFVVMDDLQYEAQNFQNRNRVKLNAGAAWLSVPLVRGSQSELILDKRIQNADDGRHSWPRRTWRTLETHYGRASYFGRYRDELEDVYRRQWERLIDLDLHMLFLARRWLGISSTVIRSSALRLQGNRTDRIIDLCRKLGATTYLSGDGGSSAYLDVEALARAGIEVVWQKFVHPVYPQRYPELGFLPQLAFLDLVFNCGPTSCGVLFHGEPGVSTLSIGA